MDKKECINIAKDIKEFFIKAGIDEKFYDNEVENLRILFPSGKKNNIKFIIRDYEGIMYRCEEPIGNAYAFNSARLFFTEDGKFKNTKPIIIFPKQNIDSSKYFIFIHELIHYMTYFFKENENSVLYGTGVDIEKIDKITGNSKSNPNKTLLNETITNLVAYYICKQKGYPVDGKKIVTSSYSKISAYIMILMKMSKKEDYIKLLSYIIANDKKGVLSLLTKENSSKFEKTLYAKLSVISKNNINSDIVYELIDVKLRDRSLKDLCEFILK